MFNNSAAPVITLDGPSASGKGTLAMRLSEALAFHYLDSGALYRALSLLALIKKIEADNEKALINLANSFDIEFKENKIYLEGQDVSEELRSENVAQFSSKIAVYPEIRQVLLSKQREHQRMPGLVTDGRDMGTVVFPNAVLKIFVIADINIRAKRRYEQLINLRKSAMLSAILRELERRDLRDSQRTHAPLVSAAGAKVLDTSLLSIDEALNLLIGWYRDIS